MGTGSVADRAGVEAGDRGRTVRTGRLREQRRRRVRALADRQSGVVSRRQLYRLGVTRSELLANVRAGRWRRVMSQSVCVHTGPLPQEAQWWAAVFEAGPRACLDGETALVAAGLANYGSTTTRVSVPRGAKVRRARGLDIRHTRRWTVEIDGIHHTWAPVQLSDALRQNDITLGHRTVLRIPLLGLRVAPDEFFAQVTAALAAAGCPLANPRSA